MDRLPGTITNLLTIFRTKVEYRSQHREQGKSTQNKNVKNFLTRILCHSERSRSISCYKDSSPSPACGVNRAQNDVDFVLHFPLTLSLAPLGRGESSAALSTRNEEKILCHSERQRRISFYKAFNVGQVCPTDRTKKSAFTLAEVFSTLFAGQRKCAFTLAEVLITLGIIGVVAAMTLPALIGKYEKMVTVNKLKRSYTTISQMFLMARKDYGDPNEWSFSYGNIRNESGESNFKDVLPQVAKTYFLPYLDVIDDCGLACKKVPNNYKWMNGRLIGQFNLGIFYTIFLKDGSIVFASVNNDGVEFNNLIIYVDINGVKGQNTVGKDVFGYLLTTKAVAKTNFWGLTGATLTRETLKDNTSRGCNKNAQGDYCGALIQYDGWQIKDDYPW